VYSQGSLNSSCFLASLPGSEPVFSIPPPTSMPYSSAPNIKMEYKPESLPSCSSAGFSPLSLTSMTYCVPSTTLSEVNWTQKYVHQNLISLPKSLRVALAMSVMVALAVLGCRVLPPLNHVPDNWLL